MTNVEETLIGCADAKVWAQEWLKVIAEYPHIPTDKGTMIGWFANAIMSGYDAGRKAEQKRDSVEKLHEIIFQAAGAATGVMLVDNPDYVFPAERVAEAVNKVCSEFGIPARSL